MADNDLSELITEILTSPEMLTELDRIADDIADRATRMAVAAVGDSDEHDGEMPFYGTDLTSGTDRARAHVWAANPAALHAENKVAPLLQIVGDDGAGNIGSGYNYLGSDVTFTPEG